MFFVGADALIGPEADGMGVSVFSDRSGDAPGGAMWASPYRNAETVTRPSDGFSAIEKFCPSGAGRFPLLLEHLELVAQSLCLTPYQWHQ